MTTTTHLFAGGAGDLAGARDAGYTPLFAANHNQAAIATVRANFPGIDTRTCDITNLDFRSIPRTRVLVGSPICTEISPAGGNPTAPRQDTLDAPARRDLYGLTRATAWCLLRADEVRDYDVVLGENVPRFATGWRLFDTWLHGWDALGKNITLTSVDAAHISSPGNPPAPQHRNRILFAFTRKGLPVPDLRPRPEAICPECGPVRGIQQWTEKFDKPGVRKIGTYGKQYWYICPTPRCHLRVEPVVRGIRDFIDWDVPGTPVSAGRQDCKKFTPFVDATLRRIEIGLERYEGAPFLAIIRSHCTVQSLDEPISTITGGNHHLLVRPTASGRVDDCEVRFIGVRTRAAAQRFAPNHHFAGGETAQKLQIGNAVPVNVARWQAEACRPALGLEAAA